VAAFGLFVDLGGRLLWGDEAETACLARNITTYGVPRADDGRNRITLLDGKDLNEGGIWTWSPWLDEYVVAGSFLAFGVSATTARLPFALVGLVSVLLLMRLAREVYCSQRVALTAGIFLASCVPFLLHARQSRYHSLLVVAEIGILNGFALLLARRWGRGALLVAVCLAVQCHSNYTVAPAAAGGVLLASVLLARKWGARLPLSASGGVVGGVLLFLPWFLYARPDAQASSLTLELASGKMLYLLDAVQQHVLPLVILILPLLAWPYRRSQRAETGFRLTERGRGVTVLLACLLVAHLALFAVLPFVYFRYLVPILPVILLLGAVCLTSFLRTSWLQSAVVGFLCLSNLLSVLTGFWLPGSREVEIPYPRYLGSLLRDYRDPLYVVVEYLRENGSPDETVYVDDPEFPIIFHTSMRVIDGRFHRIDREALPDWILSESPSAADAPRKLSLPPAMEPLYETIRLAVPATRRGASRPDPEVWQPRTAKETAELVVYRRRSR
jgi:hypothetical protein